MFPFTPPLIRVATACASSLRRSAPRLFPLALVLAALPASARAGDTLVFSDGSFGAGWVSGKIVDTTPSAAATVVSTTQAGGNPGGYRDTTHTFNAGTIVVAHFDPQYVHAPSTTSICTIDFAADLNHFSGAVQGNGAVSYRLALRQSGATYGAPTIDVYDAVWATSSFLTGLHSTDFELVAGSGPAHPDSSCTGGAIEFGFLSSNTASGGPFTRVSGIDNWLVTLHLDAVTWTDSTLAASDWNSTKFIDTTPSATGSVTNTSHLAGGFPGAWRETSHTWANGSVHGAHLFTLALHDPAIEPVYTVDFSVDAALIITSTGPVTLYAGVVQGGSYYAGPNIFVGNYGWTPYSTNGLTAADFLLHAGSGPSHPDFTNTGGLLQFGYFTGVAVWPPNAGVAVDNWTVKARLAPACPGPLGVASCFGDDITNPCPCYPSVPLGGVGRGCVNSIESRGALLIGTGAASIQFCSAILQGTGMPNSFCMYFQGTSPISAPFGDGKLCVGGTIVRLAVKLNICNSSQYPAGNEPSLQVQGGVFTPGQRIYQIWYRDSPIFCTAATFNLTNSLAINWTW